MRKVSRSVLPMDSMMVTSLCITFAVTAFSVFSDPKTHRLSLVVHARSLFRSDFMCIVHERKPRTRWAWAMMPSIMTSPSFDEDLPVVGERVESFHTVWEFVLRGPESFRLE
jgi:hypothetical protein